MHIGFAFGLGLGGLGGWALDHGAIVELEALGAPRALSLLLFLSSSLLFGAGDLGDVSLLRCGLRSCMLGFSLLRSSGGDDLTVGRTSFCRLILSCTVTASSLGARGSVLSRRLNFLLGLGLIRLGAIVGGFLRGVGLLLLGVRSADKVLSRSLRARVVGGGRGSRGPGHGPGQHLGGGHGVDHLVGGLLGCDLLLVLHLGCLLQSCSKVQIDYKPNLKITT